MSSENNDRLFLFLGAALTAILTLFFISIWFRYWSIATEVGIALGATLVILIASIATVSTSGHPVALKMGRLLLWLALLGYAAALTLSILRVAGVIQ
jgi:hypothetical protein